MASAPATDDELRRAWTRVRGRLRAELGEAAFATWLRPLTLDGLDGGRVAMRVPGPEMRAWVTERCGDRLRELWRGECGAVTEIAIEVGAAPRREADRTARGSGRDGAGRTAPADAGPGPRFAFENFVVGDANALAHDAARRVAAGERGFNPLFVLGATGTGKTHLLNAIAREVRTAGGGRRVLCQSAEAFMCRFVAAVRDNDMAAFRETLRAVDLLTVDDIGFVADKRATRDEFLHTFDALIAGAGQVVVAGDRPPAELRGLDARLRSRLAGGLVAGIRTPDGALRRAILRRKLAAGLRANGIDGAAEDAVPAETMELLARRIGPGVRELEGALNRVLAHVAAFRRPVDPETACDLLGDMLRAPARRVTVEAIQAAVADRYGLHPAELVSEGRARAVAQPRQVAMYLVRRLTGRSLPAIGRSFGGRHHTTVLHGVHRIGGLIERDRDLAVDVASIERDLVG